MRSRHTFIWGTVRECCQQGVKVCQLDWKSKVTPYVCCLLDCLEMWHQDHLCHHPHRYNKIATKMLSMFGITIEDPSVCTVLDKPKSREGQAGRQCIAIISCGLGLGSSEVLSLRYLVQAQSHGRISLHQSLERKRKHLTEDEKGPSLIHTCQPIQFTSIK